MLCFVTSFMWMKNNMQMRQIWFPSLSLFLCVVYNFFLVWVSFSLEKKNYAENCFTEKKSEPKNSKQLTKRFSLSSSFIKMLFKLNFPLSLLFFSWEFRHLIIIMMKLLILREALRTWDFQEAAKSFNP